MVAVIQIFGTLNGDLSLVGGAEDNQLYGYAGDDVMDGGEGNDSLYAGAGTDTLYGGAGDDFLDGGAGDDVMYGGAGNDTYVLSSLADQVVEDAGGGIDEVRVSFNYTLGANIENLRVMGSAGLVIGGNSLNNQIAGGAGGDTFNGLDGNDGLSGYGGNDNLYGGDGNDWLSGGDGDDILIGGNGVDAFYGGAGNDTLNVEVAELKTKVHGGDGWDRVNLDLGLEAAIDLPPGTPGPGPGTGISIDMAALEIEAIIATGKGDYIDGSGVTTSSPFGTYAQIGGAGGDDTIIGSAFSDYLDGGDGKDRVYGGAGNDTLLGGNGDDVLVGGAGQDHLTGGAGADRYVFAAGDAPGGFNFQGDKIHGFEQGADVIDLQGIRGVGFAQLTFQSAGGHTYIGIDYDGFAGVDGWIDVDSVVEFTAADFLFGP